MITNLRIPWANTQRFSLPIPPVRFLAVAALLLLCFGARANIVGPYTVDANTIHLYHFDETTLPAVDQVPASNPTPNVGTNLTAMSATGTTLGSATFSSFGNAVNFSGFTNNAAYLAALPYATDEAQSGCIKFWFTAWSGAFSYEALVQVGFDPTTNGTYTIFSYMDYPLIDDNYDGEFSLKVHCPGTGGSPSLQFLVDGSGTVSGTIPTNGPNAIAQGQWYHAAVTYSGGGSDPILEYWTLLSPSSKAANPIPCSNAYIGGFLDQPDYNSSQWIIGNDGYYLNSAWQGSIDEVRMSSIVRGPSAMMFYFYGPNIVTQPASTVVQVGNPFTLSVSNNVVGNTNASYQIFSYQWYTNGIPIPGATTNFYSVASAQLVNSGNYTVVVTNIGGGVTSAVATVTVVLPRTDAWIGTVGNVWNTSSVNWSTNGGATANSAYTTGDSVIFDDRGSANPAINVGSSITPYTLVVSNNAVSYSFTNSTGAIAGSTGITKSGTNALTVDVPATYSGPTVINGGTVMFGNNDSLAFPAGPITNNGVLVLNESAAVFTLNNAMAGTGALVKSNTISYTTLQLSGGNYSLSGSLVSYRGEVDTHQAALAGLTNVTLMGLGADNTRGTTLDLIGGVTANATLNLNGGPSNDRATLYSDINDDYSAANVWNGNIYLNGNGFCAISPWGGPITINGNIIGTNYNNFFGIRGDTYGPFDGVINGSIILPLVGLSKTDGGIWILNASGSSYPELRMLVGTVILGTNNAVATNAYISFEQGASLVDLAGHSQLLAGLTDNPLINEKFVAIGSSSTNSDSLLGVVTANSYVFGCIIGDSINGGTHKVGFLLDGGGSLTFGNTNTYSGPTTVNSGSLLLAPNASGQEGAIPNSTPITLAAGTTLDASARDDGTLTINPGQVLKGNGAFNVLGYLVNNGTIELKVSKSGATLANDSINNAAGITYGGTLQLDVTASPALTASDSFKLFSASGYSGAFTNITPNPGPGLAWDSSTLTTDGTLRITQGGPATNPTNITAVVTGGGATLQLSWPLDHTGWTLQAQTNAPGVGLRTNWVAVPGSTSVNLVNMPIVKTNGSVFYRLVYP